MRTLRLAVSVSLLALAMSGAVAEEWLPVKENNLEISSGSPLDFSGFLTNIPIEEKNRLIANADGRFAQADTPD